MDKNITFNIEYKNFLSFSNFKKQYTANRKKSSPNIELSGHIVLPLKDGDKYKKEEKKNKKFLSI
tara:strand:- start:1199 stop:1393 length:195 start_codon:yes stop_codon:yes gene_type:complete